MSGRHEGARGHPADGLSRGSPVPANTGPPMRFTIIGMATKEAEAGVLPPPEAFEAMGAYSDGL